MAVRQLSSRPDRDVNRISELTPAAETTTCRTTSPSIYRRAHEIQNDPASADYLAEISLLPCIQKIDVPASPIVAQHGISSLVGASNFLAETIDKMLPWEKVEVSAETLRQAEAQAGAWNRICVRMKCSGN